MSKKLCFVTSSKFQGKDFDRFGINILNKKYKVSIIDLSGIINKRSYSIYKKHNYKSLYEFNSLLSLIKHLRTNKYNFSVDNLNNSFKEIIIRLIFKRFNIKLIKYLGSLKPKIMFKHIYGNSNNIFKYKDSSNQILNFLKRKILKLINGKLIEILLLSGNNPENIDGYLSKNIKRIYTHTFDYNYFLRMTKHSYQKKNYILYIDQNFLYHPDYYLNNSSPFVGKHFNKHIENFLINISKKNNCDYKIALHPKSLNKKNYFKLSKKKCFLKQTPELIKNCKYVICHYSTAVSFAVLFKKPIISLTSKELDNVRWGGLIRSMSKHLNTPLFTLEKNNQNLKLINKYDKKSYKAYLNNYVKHPKSSNLNTWEDLINKLNTDYEK